MRVYLDTVITSSLVLQDLRPLAEMEAVNDIVRLAAEGRVNIVTSKMSPIEQARTADPAVRAALTAHADDVPRVSEDHRLLGFNNMDLGRYGFISSPILTDIVDDELFAKLRVELPDADAKHVLYAVANHCHVFLTLDMRDILPQRAAIEAICPQIRIVKPTELIAEGITSAGVRTEIAD